MLRVWQCVSVGLPGGLPELLNGEVMVDIPDGPAALGGIMLCVALGAWTLGRWQARPVSRETAQVCDPKLARSRVPGDGDRVSAEPPLRQCGAAPAATSPCQHAARIERRTLLAMAGPLSEMHAAISAYREAEQVFAEIGSDALPLHTPRAGANGACRYVGLTGQPMCGTPQSARFACACELASGTTDLQPWRANQPPAASFADLRV